jgi:hypothetical protein
VSSQNLTLSGLNVASDLGIRLSGGYFRRNRLLSSSHPGLGHWRRAAVYFFLALATVSFAALAIANLLFGAAVFGAAGSSGASSVLFFFLLGIRTFTSASSHPWKSHCTRTLPTGGKVMA